MALEVVDSDYYLTDTTLEEVASVAEDGVYVWRLFVYGETSVDIDAEVQIAGDPIAHETWSGEQTVPGKHLGPFPNVNGTMTLHMQRTGGTSQGIAWELIRL